MKNESPIIQICPCYVDLHHETGGVANIVRQICLQLARQRRHVLLLCGNRDLGTVKAAPGRMKINDFLTIEIFGQQSHPLLGPTRGLTQRLQALDQDCVAHVHTCFSAFTEAAMHSLHRKNIPFIFTPHGKLSNHSLKVSYWPKKVWWLTKGRKAIQYASMIGASSIEEARQLEALALSRPVHTIPNGYERPQDLPGLDNTRIISDPYILFLGYLDPRKQPQFLVEAFAGSKASQSHRLVFVGPDSYSFRETIQRKAKELGVDERVTFFGPAYAAPKWNLLHYATCVCLPSLGEGLPVVLCEALGAGTPAIFSQECNFSELADQGAGIILREFEPTLWGDAIDRICLDSSAHRKMSAEAERLRPQYTWNAIVNRWYSLYGLILKTGERTCQEVEHLHG